VEQYRQFGKGIVELNYVNGNENGSSENYDKERSSAIELFRLIFNSRRLDTFINLSDKPISVGDLVVVSADRGEDLGMVIAKYDPRDPVASINGHFVRKATPDDLQKDQQNREFEKKVLKFCMERVSTRSMDMKLTSCESQLDRRKLRIYFTADQRKDFRGLVRDLASKFHARIEMRQIGVRDDARQKDGIGLCGKRLCCASYLSHFRSITLKTAREQDLAPNPSKVSGVCGRLMCCLNYETDFYRKAAKLYPQLGSRARIGKREGKVIAVDIFRETVTLQMEDEEDKIMDIEKFHRRKKPLKNPRDRQE
jgi:cell fate regulator YaaT (PSP1 superfamily)